MADPGSDPSILAIPHTPPRKIPPFRKPKPSAEVQAFLSGSAPPSPSKTSSRSSIASKLIIRNAFVKEDPVHDPVVAVRQLIIKLQTVHPDLLEDIPVIVEPFRPNHPATCYISLEPTIVIDPDSSELRIDLLSQWKSAIELSSPQLEVAFSPAKDGTDKRMWIRFPAVIEAFRKAKLSTAPSGTSEKDHVRDLVRNFLEKETVLFTNIFVVGESVVAELVFPMDVDRLLLLRSVHIPSISPYAITISPGRHCILISPLDLVITGLSNAAGNICIEDDIRSCINRNSPDPECPSLIDFRTEGYNDDLFIFSMDSWSATQTILRASISFKDHFHNQYPGLSFPMLLFHYNNSSAPTRRTTAQVLDTQGDKVASAISQFTSRLEAVEKKTDAHGTAIQSVASHLSQVSDNINLLSSNVFANSHQISIMQHSGAIQQQRSSLQVLLMESRMKIRYPPESDDNDRLKSDIMEMESQLKLLDDQHRALLGHTSPHALPPIPPPPGLAIPSSTSFTSDSSDNSLKRRCMHSPSAEELTNP